MTTRSGGPMLGWLGIVRLGLAQTALGAIVVLTTSTINRVMVVELATPAFLPGALVGLHYVLQALRPRWGHGSDVGGRSTPWIIGGMAVLALGGFGAAASVAAMTHWFAAGVALAVLSFTLIGIGVGASGTSLLVLLSKRVAHERRPAAGALVWVMMIAGFVITAATAGRFLDPYSPERLMAVSGVVSLVAMAMTLVAVLGVERGEPAPGDVRLRDTQTSFATALREVLAEPRSRLFAIFVFVSMVAYSAQDLILEPFAGAVFGFTPGQSTALAGLQHGGVLIGMILVGVVTATFKGGRMAQMRIWSIGGCVVSAAALAALAAGAFIVEGFPFKAAVFALGVANGAFAVAAIGSMMQLVCEGAPGREGVRMGLWGASQALAFGLGGFLGAAAADVARMIASSSAAAYASVFLAEAALFVVSAWLALRVAREVGALDASRDGAVATSATFAVGAATR